GKRTLLPRAAVRAPPPGSWGGYGGDPRWPVRHPPGRQPGRLQAVEPSRTRRLSAQRRVVRQGGGLCDPGAGGGPDPLDLRILYQRRGIAGLRDDAAPRRPRVSPQLDRELLIAAGAGEWRAALLEAEVPVELYVERGDRSELGSIHLGRMLRLLPGLGAALVDIGGDRPAFLPQREIMPRGRSLHEGERVLVQIRREAQAGKA